MTFGYVIEITGFLPIIQDKIKFLLMTKSRILSTYISNSDKYHKPFIYYLFMKCKI